ncbi:MAG: hypothetical protein BroJett011_18890 [Chloroflexota bacterium]|nr:MAG: hypothetical protein BroJett011_18890 [Chloroflexota bacterium]
MYNNRIFSEGVHSVLLIRWNLRCETPLVIRNGLSVGYTEPKTPKNRGLNLKFKWAEETGEHAVSILHYGYEVNDSSISAYHFVPPSSVRGALRSWTLNHLGKADFLSNITPPPQEGKILLEAYLNNVQAALADRRHGYQLVFSLFGLALDTQDASKRLGNAGRLQLETDKFNQAEVQPIAVNGIVNQGRVGPDNVNRQMTVRNPLDRLTQASKEGGLHHFLEFCRGTSFTVRMFILNPQGCDLGLISLWRQEMNDGLLRLGALANIGRGRVCIKEESYALWKRRGAPDLDGFQLFTSAANTLENEALADLWEEYTLPVDRLDNFKTYLKAHV